MHKDQIKDLKEKYKNMSIQDRLRIIEEMEQDEEKDRGGSKK